MSEILLPPWVVPDSDEITWIDDLSIDFRPQFSRGTGQRNTFGDPRLGVMRNYRALSLEQRATLLSTASQLKGRYNSLRTLVRFALRGSFPATELFTNNTFASGTSGWSASIGTGTVADRVYRLTVSGAGTQWSVNRSLAANPTQYAPYALRSFLRDGYDSSGLSAGRAFYVDAGVATSDYSTSRGLGTVVGTVLGAAIGGTSQFPLVVNTTTGYVAGSYMEMPYCSLQRCALVDTSPNLLLQSDAFGTTWAATEATINSNNATAPDGTTTGDNLIDNANNTSHYVSQAVTVSSAAAEYALSVSLKANNRSWAAVQLRESTGSTVAYYYVNLSTGALGASPGTGANWSNLRAFVVDQGSGWYRVTIVARKTNAATTLTALIYAANADNGATYVGSSTDAIRMWRASLAQSSHAVRGALTTTAASSGTPITGNTIYAKGLPASTAGLLLPGDVVEIDSGLCFVTSPLNSDASGLGSFTVEPGPWRALNDNEPIHIGEPFGRFLLADNASYRNLLGAYADFSLNFEQTYQ